jgi:hypothetical protein
MARSFAARHFLLYNLPNKNAPTFVEAFYKALIA